MVETGMVRLDTAYLGEAAVNLITKKTPREVVRQRPIRGGGEVDYVPVYWFIQQLNELFGYLWDFEVLEQDIGEADVWVKGRLTVRFRCNGEWLTISKTNFGGSDIKVYTKSSPRGTYKAGDVIDLADDLKSAVSDCLKKCASMLGIAADIYGNREMIELEHRGPTTSQLTALYSVGKTKGMDDEGVDGWCEDKFGCSPDELSQTNYIRAVRELRLVKSPYEGLHTPVGVKD